MQATEAYGEAMANIIGPEERIVSLVENAKPLDLNLFKSRSVTSVWEFMFRPSMCRTPDMANQGQLPHSGKLRTTLNEMLSPINAEILWAAHAKVEPGRTIDKFVLSD